MLNFHAITSAFSHTHGSCLTFAPQNNWTYEMPSQIDEQNPTVFVDHLVVMGIDAAYKGKSKFGWLCESSAIIPEIIQFVKTHHEMLKNHYVKIFTNDRSLLCLSDFFEYCPAGSNMPWIANWEVAKKDKLISLIASNKRITKGHLLRHEIAQKYKNQIDLFGTEYKTLETKDDGLKPYMFSFCIENEKYDLYYTEKLTDAISCGTIPIYWGSEKISTIFNPDGFVFLDDSFDISNINEELYKQKQHAVIENFNTLKQMKPSDDLVQEKIKEYINAK